jgi:purine-binding chemotaxis protein CheW
VVEKQGELYIILDVIRIFTLSEEDKQKPRGVVTESGSGSFYKQPGIAADGDPSEDSAAKANSAFEFVKESLPALRQFYPSEINEEWLRSRFSEWSGTRTGEDLQLKNMQEADDFLSNFYSPDVGKFWLEDYANQVKSLLPNLSSNNIQVWNIGCGKGYETYSFACILKSRYPSGRIKIWANDGDIMAISQAPNLVFDLEDIPEYCRPYTTKGRSGYSFNQEIRDSIIFEYHDILNENPLPELEIILMRDGLSFHQVQDQVKLVSGFKEKLKNKGIVILGRNEVLPGQDWEYIGRDPVSVFMHTS